MSFKLGNTSISELYVGSTKIGSAYLGSTKVYEGTAPGPTPIILPDYTIRVKFSSGYTPTMGNTQTLVDSTNNVWDIYKPRSWSYLFSGISNLLEVLGANSTGVTTMSYIFNNCTSLTSVPLFDTSNVTNMSYIFNNCTSLTSVPLFDTSKVTNMNNMFYGCTSLTSVPLFDTSKVTNMYNMFQECSSLQTVPLFDTSKVTYMSRMFCNCYKVESGALSLYLQASSQTTPPSSHSQTFRNCGRDTTTGSAELAQIPSGWK